MSIIKCPECGHLISEKATVCPICGIGIAGKVVRCTFCGEVYLRSDGLCPNCHRPTKAIIFEDEEEKEDDIIDTHTDEDNSTTKADNKVLNADNDERTTPSSEENETIESDEEKTQEKDLSQEEEQYVDEDETQPTVPVKEEKKDETVVKTEKEVDSETYIDDEDNESDDDNNTETTDEEEEQPRRRRGFLPIAVSIAITALIAAVCLYFYNENKMTNERADLNAAINAGTREAIWNFQRTHPDASDESKQRANEELKKLAEREQQEAFIAASHDKAQLQAFIDKYPDHPKKAQILLTIDSLDWEDAKRVNKKEAYEKYIAEHSDGKFIKEAKEKITIKNVAATEADKGMAKSLFRDFFLAVNGKDTGRLTSSMNGKIASFMGKDNPNNDDVVAWMKQQYEGGVQTVTWKLDHNYNIKVIEQNEQKEYTMDFTGQRTSIHNDGRAVTEHYKFNAKVSNGKISSMTMDKYTPSSTSSSSSNSSTSKPSTPSNTSKPNTTNNASKPSTPSNTSKPSTTNNASKPSSSSKPSTPSNTSKPSTTNNASKPSTPSNTSKPSTSQSKPSTSNNASKPSTSQSKPSTNNNASKPGTTSTPKK